MNTTLETIETEWHERNEKSFADYARTSHIRAWWKCSICGHEWECTKANRVSKESKCPRCRRNNKRGNKNPKWNGFGEISGRQWHCIKIHNNNLRKGPTYKQFEITIEYAWELFLIQERKCIFTGNILTMWGKKDGKMTGTASLDRIDSSKGYIIGNVQWVDKRIQHIKRNWSDADFIKLCEEVATYQTRKKLGDIPSFQEWKTKAN